MEPSKIVVRHQNGKILKGYTQNFFPNKPMFHINPVGTSGSDHLVEVMVAELKAVFYVRDFAGNAEHVERKQLSPEEPPQGRLMEVTCLDGEVIVGTTTGYDPKRLGFFLFPIDTSSNNVRIFMVASAVVTARFL
jgi:hypothetical protein